MNKCELCEKLVERVYDDGYCHSCMSIIMAANVVTDTLEKIQRDLTTCEHVWILLRNGGSLCAGCYTRERGGVFNAKLV